ncbi:MAG: PH domain-containing protein [Lachnospiraceae bacterium]|nr:PH domain-containing protein [Lachnospiraceae bacterium]
MEGTTEFCERKRWVFLGLPFTFTKYTVKTESLTINSGLLKSFENDCYMYKIQDVEHTATLFEKMFGLGTVICYTGDTTHPKLMLEHIKHSKEIKNFILEASEKARVKRRTLNTLDIGDGRTDEMEFEEA